jgi:hypothetical protein
MKEWRSRQDENHGLNQSHTSSQQPNDAHWPAKAFIGIG